MKHCEEADGLMAPDKDTDGFVFNHLMLRIKDPKKTLNFYSKLMGMRLIMHIDMLLVRIMDLRLLSYRGKA